MCKVSIDHTSPSMSVSIQSAIPSPFISPTAFTKKTNLLYVRQFGYYLGNPAIFMRPLAFRPCLATGLA